MKKNKIIKKIDRKRSVENLENDYWSNEYLGECLIEKCYQYRKIPIQNLTIEQLRLMIGQSLGLDFLLPIAIEFLEKDMLSEGDFYEGDLLEAILRIKKEYWKNRPEFHAKMVKLIEDSKTIFDNNDNAAHINIVIKERFDNFKSY